jgi:RNA polymerase sigma-70 factor, ECF subfamily
VETIPLNDSSANEDLVRRAAAGNSLALNDLLEAHRDRLKRMIRLRLNRRLQGRLDASDVLQEAYLEISRRLDEYLQNPAAPFFLWLRKMAGLKLAEIHRRHLGTQMRDADRDLSIYRGALPAANSVSLAAQLLGELTSPSEAVVKAEMRVRLQEALDSMDPIDREIIALRHFEQLNSEESAEVLGMSKSGASSRYIRALKRLRSMLAEFPEFRDL